VYFNDAAIIEEYAARELQGQLHFHWQVEENAAQKGAPGDKPENGVRIRDGSVRFHDRAGGQENCIPRQADCVIGQ
jgi:hypothetical protein